jgi:two-component system chemotaxis sensor kinase CheA
MLQTLIDFVVLPPEVTSFERRYLERLNKIALFFFLAHLPVFVLVSWLCGTGPLAAAGLTGLVLVGPFVAYHTLRDPRHMSIVSGFTAMCLGGLLVHFGRGPMQIEMHFYFFVLIALLAVFANPVAVVTAAVTVALHHLVVFTLLPRSVFNYDASYWAVAVHALFVLLESVGACFVARSFFDNVIGLERIVESRTRELDGRNQAMRLLLDNVGQGFVTLGYDGVADRERSAAVDRWLGASVDAGPIWQTLKRLDPQFGDGFETAWSAIGDGSLPLELALDQLPKRLQVGARVWSFGYSAIGAGTGEPPRVLLVITDITAEVSRERAESEQQDFQRAFNHFMRDRTGFLEFIEEAEKLVGQSQESWRDKSEMRRILHTLKGNCGLFGISRLAGLCHELETTLRDSAENLSPGNRRRIADEWKGTTDKLGVLLESTTTGTLEVDEQEIERVAAAARGSQSGAKDLAERVLSWKLEPIERRFARLAAQAQAIADRTGKGHVDVVIETNGLRLAPGPWREFWAAFTHAIRNAIDHGIETPDERRALGKSPTGQIRFCSRREGNRFIIEIADDGRGVDWEAVRARARALDLPYDSRGDLLNALFHDGLTTKEVVTAYSGRGIGMGALRSSCQKSGGHMEVVSAGGRGTMVRFSWPWGVSMHEELPQERDRAAS